MRTQTQQSTSCMAHLPEAHEEGKEARKPLGERGGGGWQNLGRGGRECTLHNVNLHDAEASESAKDSTYNVHSCV